MPLILAWALTIHKSQGSTLDIAEVDAGSGIFECGQTYVALSRVKSLEGLYLTSFDVKRVRINKKVQEFYELLEQEVAKKMLQQNQEQEQIQEQIQEQEVEILPETYVEITAIPLVEATIIGPIPIATIIE